MFQTFPKKGLKGVKSRPEWNKRREVILFYFRKYSIRRTTIGINLETEI